MRQTDEIPATNTGNTQRLAATSNVMRISNQRQEDSQDVQYDTIEGQEQHAEISSEYINIKTNTDSDHYEKPSVYINMLDRTNEYQSLNN